MPIMLNDIGITSSSTQLLLNALNTVTSFLSGIVGSPFVDRWGRRSLFLWATFLTGLCYIPLNIIASQISNGKVSDGGSYAFTVFIFLHGVFFSFGCES
jgi:MFS family permease